MKRLLIVFGLVLGGFGVAADATASLLSCENFLDTAVARAARTRAHAIFAAGEPEDDVIVAYLGLSNGQLLDLLNEGEVHADRWGQTPQYAYVVAGHPAVERLQRAMPDVEVARQTSKFQFDLARDDAWVRSVVEIMETPHRNLRNDGFLTVLGFLRFEMVTNNSAAPTVRQITEAASQADLPHQSKQRYGEVRRLTELLDIPWHYAHNSLTTRNARLRDAFSGLPKDAGAVLALSESALDKLNWVDDFSEFRSITFDDVVGIDPPGLTEFRFFHGLRNSEPQL